MNWKRRTTRRACGLFAALACLALASEATAGDRWLRRRAPIAVPVPTQRVLAAAPAGELGTFGPTPYLFVRGNGTSGGGYSPLGTFGDASMDLYGPLSSYRSTAAPVVVYTRGFNGVTEAVPATSFSNPNRPGLNPVVYPTQANSYYGFPASHAPPWWINASNWIDQN